MYSGRQQLLVGGGIVLVLGVDGDEPGDPPGVGGGVQARDHAAERVAGQDVGAGNMGGAQQRAQIANDVARAPRHRDRVASAHYAGTQVGARAVVGAHAGKPCDGREHRPSRPRWCRAPDIGAVARPGLEHDRRPTGAAALEVGVPRGAVWRPGVPRRASRDAREVVSDAVGVGRARRERALQPLRSGECRGSLLTSSCRLSAVPPRLALFD